MDNFNHIESQKFYNSVEYNEADWQKANDKAMSLQKKIEGVYTANPGVEITPYMMLDYLEGKLQMRINLNSLRRSITNLKNDLIIDIIKGKTRMGREGVPEHYYVLHGTGPVHENVYKKGEQTAADIAGQMLSDSN